MIIVIKEVCKKCKDIECLSAWEKESFKDAFKLRRDVKEFARYTNRGRIFNRGTSTHEEAYKAWQMWKVTNS